MRLGIDLGTTRTIVAAHDRGNFPVVGFTSPSGDLCDHYPTVTAEVQGSLVHGLDAEAAALAGAPALRSWKRLLQEVGPQGLVRVGRVQVPALELVTGFLSALRRDLFLRSNLPRDLSDPLEAAVSVPANAHSTQRFLTLEAFRRAGFAVRAVLNEPSAAGVEFAHRHARALSSRREHVVVYDLGGGTFDAALVLLAGGGHEVITTSGVSRLGGDDFDEALLEMALAAAPEAARAVGDGGEVTRVALLEECRVAKEALNPSSRRIVLELRALGGRAPATPVVLDVSAFYERTRPLVERTLAALDPVLRRDEDEASRETEVAGIYVVGGASGLPVVPRILRERFGRRVHRSPHPSGATAIGLAIAAAAEDRPLVGERFTRHLGVFRERAAGERISFDGIVPKDTPMPAGHERIAAVRRYRAHHNLGHFRFVECGALDDAGDPSGDITPHAELLFPFSASLRDSAADLGRIAVERLGAEGPLIEERYEIDAAGVVAVTITDLDAGYARSYTL